MLQLLLALFMFLGGYRDPSPVGLAAQARADGMYATGTLYHDLSVYPQSCGRGEILARGYTPSDALVAWAASPPHVAVIGELHAWSRSVVAASGDVLVVAFVLDC